MQFLSTALAGFLAAAGLIIAIGAQNAFVLRRGLQRSHVGLVVVVCTLADVALICCGVAGIGAVVQRAPILLQLFRFGGAAFIGGYGLVAARRALRGGSGLAPADTRPTSWQRVLVTCLAFTFLNPHVYLDTMVLLGSLSTRYGADRWAFALGASCTSILWFCLLGFGARALLPIFRTPRAWRVLDAAMAVFMVGLAVLLVARPIA